MSNYRGPIQTAKPLPAPHGDIRVEAREYPSWDGVIVEYVGPSLGALVAAGCITQAMADSLSGPAQMGKKRSDERGHGYHRRKKSCKAFPHRVLVSRTIRNDRDFALTLPGVAMNVSSEQREAAPAPSARRISWTVEGKVIIPDWPLLRAATAAWREARAS